MYNFVQCPLTRDMLHIRSPEATELLRRYVLVSTSSSFDQSGGTVLDSIAPLRDMTPFAKPMSASLDFVFNMNHSAIEESY